MPSESMVNRRDVLKYGGASLTAVGLAGCTGNGGGDDDGGDGDSNGGSDGDSNGGSDDSYPNEPVRIVVPFSEGGSTDTYARQLQPYLSEELGVEVHIENIPGSASLRGAEEVYRADPDGYTYLMMNPPSTPLSNLLHEPGWDIRELKGVAAYESTSILIMTNPDTGIDSFEGLVEAYQNGDLEQFAGQTIGSYYHVNALYLKENYDLDYDRYIGYEGNGPTTQSVVSGENPSGISSSAATVSFTQDDRLNVPVLLGSVGTPAYPDKPTLPELGYESMDFLANLTRTFVAPPETPDNIIQTMSSAIESALQYDEVQQWGEETGANFLFEGPEYVDQTVEDVITKVRENLDVESLREEIQ